MTAEERRQLLGEEVAAHARAEAQAAATEYPPGPEVIAALRPILTSRMRIKPRVRKRVSATSLAA